jgi:hypothetical protein
MRAPLVKAGTPYPPWDLPRARYQKQVFLEDPDCARRRLKNQAFASAASGWVLEGTVSMPIAALLAGVITSE